MIWIHTEYWHEGDPVHGPDQHPLSGPWLHFPDPHPRHCRKVTWHLTIINTGHYSDIILRLVALFLAITCCLLSLAKLKNLRKYEVDINPGLYILLWYFLFTAIWIFFMFIEGIISYFAESFILNYFASCLTIVNWGSVAKFLRSCPTNHVNFSTSPGKFLF